MRNLLLIIIGVIDVLANLPYILDIFKGKTKPNIATWSTWTLLNGIVVFAALAVGSAINTVILAAAYLIGSLTVLVIGLFHGTRKYTFFDGVCQSIAILGLVSWQASNNPNIALVSILIVDIFAIIPTLKHAYRYPSEETWATYAIAGVCALITLCLASSFNFAAIAMPFDFFFMNFLLVLMVLYRRNKLKEVATSKDKL